MIEEKIKIIEEKINKEKQKSSDIIRRQKMKNKRLTVKLQDLEGRSRKNNVRFDGVREYENESWNDTEEVLKDNCRQIKNNCSKIQ